MLLAVKKDTYLTLFYLGTAQVVGIILGLIGASILARYVSLDLYGNYQTILSLTIIVGGFCLPGLLESVKISAAKRFDGNLVRILALRVGASVLGGIALIGVAAYYRNSQPQLASAVLITAFVFPIVNTTVWQAWLNGRGRLNQLAAFSIGQSFLGVAAVLVLVFLGATSLNQFVLILIGTQALFSVVTIIYLISQRENKTWNNATIKYGFHTTAAAMLSSLIYTDKLLLNHFFSAATVAIYSVAMLFPAQIKSIYLIFSQMITPKIYGADSVTDAWEYLRAKMPLLLLLFAVIGIAGFVALPILVPLFFSERYVLAVGYAKWLWLSLSLSAPATFLGDILRAQKKIRFVYAFELAMPIVRVILYIWLIQYGIMGMVLSTISVQLAAVALFTTAFMYYLKTENR